jgi:hypothetical protein
VGRTEGNIKYNREKIVKIQSRKKEMEWEEKIKDCLKEGSFVWALHGG